MLRDFVNKEFRGPFNFAIMMAVVASALVSFLLMVLYVELKYENVIVRKISESISENQFAVDIAEVESAVIGEQRSIIGLPTVNVAESKTTERFLYQLLRQEFFVKEIKERDMTTNTQEEGMEFKEPEAKTAGKRRALAEKLKDIYQLEAVYYQVESGGEIGTH